MFRSLISGGQAVYHSLNEMRMAAEAEGVHGLELPSPDTRFFQAALELFSLKPGAQGGWSPRSSRWTPMLQEVAEVMVSAGHPVPSGFRRLFVGRWEPGTRHFARPPTLNRSPFAYSHVTKIFNRIALDIPDVLSATGQGGL